MGCNQICTVDLQVGKSIVSVARVASLIYIASVYFGLVLLSSVACCLKGDRRLGFGVPC